MPSIQDTIVRAVRLRGKDILGNKKALCVVLEDLAPDLEKERDFIEKVYNDDVGKMFCKACSTTAGRKIEYLREIDRYLDEENGRNEGWRRRLISYFDIVVMGGFSNLSTVTTQSQMPKGSKTVNETQKNTTLPTDENVWEKIEKAKLENNNAMLVQLYSSIHDGADGEKEAQMYLGQYYEDEGQLDIAFKHYYRAAVLGDTKGQFFVGYMYEYGEGTAVNIEQAIAWYLKAAANGNRGAQHNIGYFFYSGNGVPQDYKKAFNYFMMAANQGKPDSMLNIGVMYENGQYVKKDKAEALKWYKMAMENGDPNAKQYHLALLRELA